MTKCLCLRNWLIWKVFQIVSPILLSCLRSQHMCDYCCDKRYTNIFFYNDSWKENFNKILPFYRGSWGNGEQLGHLFLTSLCNMYSFSILEYNGAQICCMVILLGTLILEYSKFKTKIYACLKFRFGPRDPWQRFRILVIYFSFTQRLKIVGNSQPDSVNCC